MLKHYIEWFYPGSFVSESSVELVATRTCPDVIPNKAYAYRFFDREEVTCGEEVLKGEVKNYSPTTYFGKAYTLDQVKALQGNYRILISNMEINKWDRVVQIRFGQWMPLREGDVVVAE